MRGTQSVARNLRLDLRRGTLSVVSIGAPVVVGVLSGQAGAGLVGGITGLLLTLSDTEGSLASRLGTTADVALGIAVGAALGKWLAEEHAAFWIVFFVGIFAAGLLNQVGKGPHFAVRFGAIAFAVIAGLPELTPEILWYFAGTVALCLVAKLVDQLSNGPLPDGPPWPGSIAAPLSHWLRFALAYAIAASTGLWIGVQSGSVRAVWTAAIVLVFMLPSIRITYTRIVQGVIGTVLAVLTVWLLDLADAPQAVLTYTGPAVPGWMIPTLYTPQEIKAQTEAGVDPARAIVWRCMGGKIWACVQGNAPICGKANQDKTPTKAMRDFCAGQPNADVIPLSVIGHENPDEYDWTCKGKQRTITKQIFQVDARGFPTELWKTIALAGLRQTRRLYRIDNFTDAVPSPKSISACASLEPRV